MRPTTTRRRGRPSPAVSVVSVVSVTAAVASLAPDGVFGTLVGPSRRRRHRRPPDPARLALRA